MTREIDEIDSKILKALLIESRSSFTEVAKLCSISVTAVTKRYQRLKKIGIIVGEHMYLNPLSVGYESIADVGIIADVADREKVAELLKTKSSVRFAAPIGKYDLCALVFAHKFNELSALVQQIDVKPFVKSLNVLIFADLWDNPWHPENLLIQPFEKTTEKRKPRPTTVFAPMKLDDIDLDICKALMENSRTPFKVLSDRLGLSTSNIIERYNVLRDKHVLNLSSITVDLSKLGYKANVDVYIRVGNRGDMPEVEEHLLQIPNLTFCAKFVGGAYDLRVAVNVRDFADINSVREDVYSIENIKNAEFYIFAYPCFWPDDFMGKTLI